MPPESQTITFKFNSVSITAPEIDKHGGFHSSWLHNIGYHVNEDEATPERVVRNGPATIVFWKDGTKTVVKCHDEDYDPEKGLAMALCRKLWGRCQTERFVRMVEEQETR